MPEFPSLPEQATAFAGLVDQLLLVLMGFGVAFALIVLIAFLLRARKREKDFSDEQSSDTAHQSRVQIVWAVIGVVLLMALFVWSEQVYLSAKDAPANAKDVVAVGKRWMWKFQHYPDGQREIDELHLTVGEPVKLTMTSQDVIHSLSIPAFRVQQDVIPGRYTTMWFRPTEAGEYDILSAEYNGTGYTKMVGRVIVMAVGEQEEVALDGEELFAKQGCNACHVAGGAGGAVGPAMDGLFGREESLESGETVLVDEAYLRESILDPMAKVVAGFPPAMPPYEGVLGDAEVAAIIDYIKSLSDVTLPEAAQPPAEAETPTPEAGEPAGEVTEETLSSEAQTILFTQGCVACHGKQLEGVDGPILVGLAPEYIKERVRAGKLEAGMIAYGPELVSDEDLDLLAGEIAALSLQFTGVELSQPVIDALTAAQEALDAGDKAGVEAALQDALDAASDAPEGVVTTLNVMIEHLAQDDWAEYIQNRLSILLGTGQTQAAAPAAGEDTAAEAGEATPAVSEEDLKAAQTLYFTKGCVGCHGPQMDGLIGPTFVGLDPDYMIATARAGRAAGGMPAYTPDQVSDEELALMAQTFGALTLADTGVTLSQPVLDALMAAQEALDAGDKAGVEANLQAALDAAADAPDGVKKTLAVMIANLALDDWADYVGNRLALLLGS